MATNVKRDHHLLTRNLKLNDNYISNDGGNEGISITDAGAVVLTTALAIAEQAHPPDHVGSFGKLWVNSDQTPNELYFTNESGNDIQLTKAAASVATVGTLAADDILEGDAAISIGTSSGDIVFNNNSDAEWLTFNTNDISDGGIAVSEIVGPDNARLRIRARGHAHNLQLKSENNIDMCVIDNDGAATTAVATFFISSLNTSDKTISGTWVASQGEGTLVSQLADQTAPADQYTGSTSGSDCVVSYLTTGAGNPIFNIYPARGGTGHVAAVTITGCTTADDSSTVTHSTATLTRFMSIRGTGMPTGAYIGSVTDSTHFVIHVDGDVVNATSSGSGRTLTARHRIVFQDAHASGSNYAILEVDTVGSGYIQFGVASSQTDGSLQQRGLISMNNGLTAVGLGIYATNGDLNFGSFGTTNRSCSFEFDAVQFLSSDNFGLPGYMDVRLGDAAFIGDGACNLYRMRLDGTDDNRIFQITATDVSVGDARDADNVIDSSEWNDAGGLTTTVTKTTGDTLINGSGEIKITPKALGGAVEFEKIFTGTDNTTSKLVHIDYDATGNTASGQTINNIALEIDLNSDSQTAVGTVNNTSINIDMVGGTSGVQSNTGIDIAVSGADTNYALITSGGNVGIGVTDPDTTLEVAGTSKVTFTGTTTNALEIDATALTTGFALAIDVDDSLTASATKTLSVIDYDKSGVTASGQLSSTTGLAVSLFDAATNHASGNVLMQGASISILSSNAQGTIAQTGLILNVAMDGVGDAALTTGLAMTVMDGGTDILMKSSADQSDYCSISTTASGATTIATVDSDDAEAAHLTFDIQGDTIFKGDIADGTSTEVARIDASESSLLIKTNKRIEFGNAGEYIVGDGTDLDIVSSNDATINAGGTIILDSADGTFEMLGAGTTAKFADMYAGMILGCTHVFGSGTGGVFHAVTTAWVSLLWDTDKYALVTFVVPPSNKVKISVQIPYILASGRQITLGLATDSSATTLNTKYENDIVDTYSNDSFSLDYSWVVDGSDHSWSAGDTETLYIMAYASGSTRFYTGGTDTSGYGGVIVEATALPATIGDGSEP